MLHRFATQLAGQAADLGYAESLQCGKPIRLTTEGDSPAPARRWAYASTNTPPRGRRVLDGAGLAVRTPHGRIRAQQVALATNAFPSPLRRLRPYVVPVYDHVLMTEPLTDEQLAAIGWRGRRGLADTANHFHYFRLTSDQRVLWGGYDIVYRYGGGVRSDYDHRPATYRTLARHFFRCFPQLAGVRFSHAWGGAIDTCSRFSAFFGTAHRGRGAYALGCTGLGVGASRFGAEVMFDLLGGTERTRLEIAGTRPLPFPPEPLRCTGIGITQWSMARADAAGGRRNLWLRAMDKVGLGWASGGGERAAGSPVSRVSDGVPRPGAPRTAGSRTDTNCRRHPAASGTYGAPGRPPQRG